MATSHLHPGHYFRPPVFFWLPLPPPPSLLSLYLAGPFVLRLDFLILEEKEVIRQNLTPPQAWHLLLCAAGAFPFVGFVTSIGRVGRGFCCGFPLGLRPFGGLCATDRLTHIVFLTTLSRHGFLCCLPFPYPSLSWSRIPDAGLPLLLSVRVLSVLINIPHFKDSHT